MYQIVGISGKSGNIYISRKKFKTYKNALLWGYSKVYKKTDLDNYGKNRKQLKRKNPPFHNWKVLSENQIDNYIEKLIKKYFK